MFKKRGGHNVKEPDFFLFFFLFCFFLFFVLFCFVCFCFCFCFFLGGVACFSGGTEGGRSLPTEYKTGTTEN